MPHLKQLPHFIDTTIDFKIMGINIVFEHRVMVNFEVIASIFETKLINAAAFNQVNMVHIYKITCRFHKYKHEC